MTTQTVAQARKLAQKYRTQYKKLCAVMRTVPGAAAQVQDDHVPLADLNYFAYTFMVMADVDIKVGYSAELAQYERADTTRALGAIVNFARDPDTGALKSATIVLNNNLPSNSIISALLHAFGWLLQNERAEGSVNEWEFFEMPLVMSRLYDENECNADNRLIELNKAALFALFVMMPDDDLLCHILSGRTIGAVSKHYGLPASAIKTRLMLGIYLDNDENEPQT